MYNNINYGLQSQTPKQIQIEPLTYLLLIASDEKKSNAFGKFYDTDNECKLFTDKDYTAGYTPCTTLGSKKTAPLSTIDIDTATLNKIDNTVKDSDQNKKLKEEYKKTGKGKEFTEWLKAYVQTDSGRELLNQSGFWLSTLLGKQATPEVDVSKDLYNDANKPKSSGLNPVWWVIIGVGGLFLLGGIGYAIYRFGVKPKTVQVKTN